VRQLRDAKIKPLVVTFDAELLLSYALACGWVLARAHAVAGNAAGISGYLGSNDQFDEALGDFSVSYADQAERDHAALLEAIRAGRVEATAEA
jgi:predicted alpha/beta hydrolase